MAKKNDKEAEEEEVSDLLEKTHYLDLAHSEEMYIISVISFKSRLKTHFYILAFT